MFLSNITSSEFSTLCICITIVIIAIIIAICTFHYQKLEHGCSSSLADSNRYDIRKLQIRVTNIENELIKKEK